MSNKVKVLVGIAVALVVGLGVVAGTALAQSGDQGTAPPAGTEDGGLPLSALCARFQEGVASELGVSVEAVREAFKASALAMLDEARRT